MDEFAIAIASEVVEKPRPARQLIKSPATVILQAETTDLEIPNSIWLTMFGAYAVFFGALFLATGREKSAIFMIVVSVLYAFVYFGVASLLFTQNMPQNRSLFSKGLGPLATFTGPMDKLAVAGQILTIPLCFALFGIAMLIFRIIIMG